VLEDFNAYEIAEATGIHHNTIYNWINHNVQPSHANFLATINAMGYTMALTVIKD
jgi:DNA-binding phage protein